MRLDELFDVSYGHSLELNRLQQVPGGVNFVSRTARNNGVSATVSPVEGLAPAKAGTLSVALGGSVLETFLQPAPYFTGYHVAVLTPRRGMGEAEMLYWAQCIKANRYRYSYGRQANRTLASLELPAQIPAWVQNVSVPSFSQIAQTAGPTAGLPPFSSWKPFTLEELFRVKKGVRKVNRELTPGGIPYVRASDKQNGIVGYFDLPAAHPGGTLTVSYNGSVGEAFFQPSEFFASDDVNVLYPLGFDLTPARGIFVCTLIRREKYRYNYGRKWRLELMEKTRLLLPVTTHGTPDWAAVDAFIASLPWAASVYSAEVESVGKAA